MRLVIALFLCFTLFASLAAAQNIVINKTDAPDPVNNGSTLVYNITISNNGLIDATNVTLTELFDANTTFVSSEPNPTVANTTWSLGTLAASSTTVVNITVSVLGTVTNGTTLANSLNVTYMNSSGANFVSNATASTTVLVPPSLSVTKTASPEPVYDGETLSYTITIVNTGGPALEVSINDTLDERFVYAGDASTTPVSESSTSLLWLVNLTADQTLTITLSGTAKIALQQETITNNVAVTYANSTTITTINASVASTAQKRPVGGGGGSPNRGSAGGSTGGGRGHVAARNAWGEFSQAQSIYQQYIDIGALTGPAMVSDLPIPLSQLSELPEETREEVLRTIADEAKQETQALPEPSYEIIDQTNYKTWQVLALLLIILLTTYFLLRSRKDKPKGNVGDIDQDRRKLQSKGFSVKSFKKK